MTELGELISLPDGVYRVVAIFPIQNIVRDEKTKRLYLDILATGVRLEKSHD